MTPQDPVTISALAAIASALAALASVALTIIIIWYTHTQTSIQKKVSDVQAFYSVAQRMEQIRGDRQIVRDYVKKGEIQIPPPDDVQKAADHICREFDILGLLDRTGFIDSRLVDLFYSVPFVLLYNDILGSYVEYLRKPERRGPTHFWELVQFYDRVQNVPGNHPSFSGAADWPINPRLKKKG